MADDVLIDKRADGVGLVTLNRPDSLNAMGGDLLPLLGEIIRDCAEDKNVRAVVLTGAGRAFCAGGDVKQMDRGERLGGDAEEAPQSVGAAVETAVARLAGSQMETSFLLHTMPKPTIAMVNGHAVGAGLSLALACDLRIASDRAKFGTAFGRVGMSGDYGGSFFMQRLVGSGKTRELYFTGEIIEADEALRLGMVNRVVPHDDLETETLGLAAKLAAGPTRTFGRMKENFELGERSDLKTLMDREALNMNLSMMSADAREALRAFVEKREPKFTGN